MSEFDTDRTGSPDVIAGAFPPIAAPVVRVSSPRLVAGLAMTEVAKLQKELAAVTAERDRLAAENARFRRFCQAVEDELWPDRALLEPEDEALLGDVRILLGKQGTGGTGRAR